MLEGVNVRKSSKRKLKVFGWWLYVVTGLALLGFIAPALISLPDTLAVIFGLVLLAAYGIWSWELWISDLIIKLKESM